MIKKAGLIAIILLLLTSANVFAGDIPEAIMSGEQQALFIGEITSINDDNYTITPTTVMMGSVPSSELKIQRFDRYYGTSDKPQSNDVIVAVLLDDHTIDSGWIFKCTSDNYKTLNLVSERYDIVVRYEKLINQGEYFKAQQRLDSLNASTVSADSAEPDTKNETPTLLIPGLILVAVLAVLAVAKKRS